MRLFINILVKKFLECESLNSKTKVYKCIDSVYFNSKILIQEILQFLEELSLVAQFIGAMSNIFPIYFH